MGDLLFRLGRRTAARSAFATAAELIRNALERAFLLARAHDCIRDERASGIGRASVVLNDRVWVPGDVALRRAVKGFPRSRCAPIDVRIARKGGVAAGTHPFSDSSFEAGLAPI